jgi:hypothetical protein
MHIIINSTYDNFCEKYERKEENIMNNQQLTISTTKSEYNDGGTGYKIIEFNVTDPTENLFAVVTPVKMK